MLKFPFSKCLQQTYCAFLIMQSKKQALYLWISEEDKKCIYILKCTLVRSLHRQALKPRGRRVAKRPCSPLITNTHSNDALSQRGTPSIQSGFVRHGHIYTFIYIQTDRRPGLQFVSELKAFFLIFSVLAV